MEQEKEGKRKQEQEIGETERAGRSETGRNAGKRK